MAAIFYIDWRHKKAYVCQDESQFEGFLKYQSGDEYMAEIDLAWNNWLHKLEWNLKQLMNKDACLKRLRITCPRCNFYDISETKNMYPQCPVCGAITTEQKEEGFFRYDSGVIIVWGPGTYHQFCETHQTFADHYIEDCSFFEPELIQKLNPFEKILNKYGIARRKEPDE